jgi:transposase
MKIDKEDIKIIEEMAKKYNVSIMTFSKMIAKLENCNQQNLKLQIRYTKTEYDTICKKIREINEKYHTNMSDGTYTLLCVQEIIKKNVQVSVLGINKITKREKSNEAEKRTIRKNVRFFSASDYNEVIKYAEELGMSYSNFIRYAALNVDLLNTYSNIQN